MVRFVCSEWLYQHVYVVLFWPSSRLVRGLYANPWISLGPGTRYYIRHRWRQSVILAALAAQQVPLSWHCHFLTLIGRTWVIMFLSVLPPVSSAPLFRPFFPCHDISTTFFQFFCYSQLWQSLHWPLQDGFVAQLTINFGNGLYWSYFLD